MEVIFDPWSTWILVKLYPPENIVQIKTVVNSHMLWVVRIYQPELSFSFYTISGTGIYLRADLAHNSCIHYYLTHYRDNI